MRKGLEILRKEKREDPGSGNLGLNINMDGESFSIAQKSEPTYHDPAWLTNSAVTSKFD